MGFECGISTAEWEHVSPEDLGIDQLDNEDRGRHV